MKNESNLVLTDSTVDDWLLMSHWKYSLFFNRLLDVRENPVVREIERYINERRLDEHPFFRLAFNSKAVLSLWVSQELVMTNAFSQMVLRAASYIPNVHARAVMAEIAFGEHGTARRGFAEHAHPQLLDQLRASINLDPALIEPAMPTRDFISRLRSHLTDTLTALAYIGVGNERLIIPEYAAIKKCFAHQWPECDYEPFLKANLVEDITHSKLCYELASMLIQSEEDSRAFKAAAIASIESRFQYFDDLSAMAEDGSLGVL
jgi:hypothetical protein